MAERATPRWLDVLYLSFLAGLALLPPLREYHKHLILLGIGLFQVLESTFVNAAGKIGPYCAVAIKISLATILIGHTGDPAPINSSYWPIFWLPIITAAIYFGPLGTLIWSTVASAAYCSYLIPAREQFEITLEGVGELVLRILFMYLVGMVVNRFSVEYRQQVRRSQKVSETLREANRSLRQAQAEARRAERLAALGQLSAGLAHEIRNPLGVIKGSAEMLEQRLTSSDSIAKELSGFIYTEVNRLSALVGRFLDFARPSKMELHPEDLGDVMESSLRTVAQQGGSANVRVSRDFASGLPPVMLDRELCEQAFTNLLSNACEAMGEEGGELRLRIRPDSSDDGAGQKVLVEIEDTGPGIPPEMREQIFNPFVTTKKSGVGLGLAIVSKIVDAHGGSVTLCDVQHHGACFRLIFPVEKAGEAATQH